MDIQCLDIGHVLDMLIDNGNSIQEISEWTKIKQVIHMKKKLSLEMKEKIRNNFKNLEYWRADKTPYDPENEGFVCYKCSVAIVFPI